VFLSVPASLLLTETQLVASESPQLRPEARLALRLLIEASLGDDSRWAPYLRSLPQRFGDAGGWSEADCEALQEPHAVAAAQALAGARRDDWRAAAEARERLLPPRLRGWAAWCWAASCVATRTVYAGAESGTAGALCPVGDLVNHSCVGEEGEAGSGELAGDAYCFRTRRPLRAGEQALVSYGSYTSLELLLLYGFVPESSPTGDTARLPRLPHLRSGLEEVPDEELFVAVPGGAPGYALLAALRRAHAPHALRRARGHAAAAGQPLDGVSEEAAWGRIAAAARDALRALPSAEEDAAGVEAAVLWRLRHKRALRAAAEAAEARLAALRCCGGATLVLRGPPL